VRGLLLPRDADRKADARLDTLGLALLSPGLAALVYGLSEADSGSGLTSGKFLGGVGVGAVLIAAFAVHSLRRGHDALVDIRVFRNRSFSTTSIGIFIYSGSLFALFVLTDRMGSRTLAAAGAVIVLAGVLIFTRIQVDTSTYLLTAAAFVVGLGHGHGLMMPAMMDGAYRGLSRSDVPNATTAFNILVRIGGAFGTAALAVVLQNYLRDRFPHTGGSLGAVAAIRSPGAAVQLTGASGDTFWWSLAIIVAALVPILLIPRRSPADN
jgi:hypothetical protein